MTQVLTDEQKKIHDEIDLTLQHAAAVAGRLVGLGRHSDALITTINAAIGRLERVGSEVVRTILVAQHACGDWSIMETVGDNEAPGIAGLTAAQVIDHHARMVMAACPEVAEPMADTQQATDAACVTGCDGPDNSEWRRVRAMELAISASGGMHIDSLIKAAGRIETFLKRGA